MQTSQKTGPRRRSRFPLGADFAASDQLTADHAEVGLIRSG